MVFQNGQWVAKKAVSASFAASVADYAYYNGVLTVWASSKSALTRFDLGGTELMLELTAPANNIIGVKITHFFGAADASPVFALNTEPADTTLDETPDALVFRSGALCAEIAKSGWCLTFTGGGRFLTQSADRSTAYYLDERGAAEPNDFGDSLGSRPYIEQQLDLQVGECLYGLGERFGPLVKNGQHIDMWQSDGGTSTDQAYKNVPFYLSNKGYGVFVNSTKDVSFELASAKVERACFSQPGEAMQYFVVFGETPRDILERYTFLTGRPALPPAWSFGLWLSTSFVTDYDEKTVTSFIDGMAQRGIPLRVFHFDCYWMKGNHWTDFTWDADQFPNPAEMLARYKARGLNICVWINSYIAQRSVLFKEAAEKGYLIKKADGSVWQTDLWQSGMGIVDFTNPEARAWYCEKLEALMDMGVDCFKTDFGERIPVRDVVYYDGSDPVGMHNYYTHLYNKTVFEAVEKKKGKGGAVVFARSGTAGTQQFPVHWGGDNWGRYPSMAETLRAGLSLAVSGYGFWSHDISGFEATASADLYKRWCAFGLLSSHSRLHGSSSYRVPWNFDEEASDVLSYFVRLKCTLMPYIYRQAVLAHQYGTPLLRPMVFDFPDDPAAAWLDRQYMLGDSLLVAPVFSQTGEVTFYVPEGEWTSLLDGRLYTGGRYYTEKYDYFSLPLLVRPNTLLPIGSVDTKPDYDFTQHLTVRVFAPSENTETSVTVPNLDGSAAAFITARLSAGKLRLTSSAALPGLNVEAVGNTYTMPGTELDICL